MTTPQLGLARGPNYTPIAIAPRKALATARHRSRSVETDVVGADHLAPVLAVPLDIAVDVGLRAGRLHHQLERAEGRAKLRVLQHVRRRGLQARHGLRRRLC